MAPPIITLTSDFGTKDSYAAAMKGVILNINPQATIVDVSHEVPPQDVVRGAFVLGTAHAVFPASTIHVAVVDPTVGTARLAMALETPEALFLAPNNGLLTLVVWQDVAWAAVPADTPFLTPVQVAVPHPFRAFTLTTRRYWRHPVSFTFHGRDIFAPVAAHLSRGVPVEELGEPVEQMVCLYLPPPQWEGDWLVGRVIHIDHFGNVVTTLAASLLPKEGSLEVRVRGQQVPGLARTYAEVQGVEALIGSHGLLELARQGGSAADTLGVEVGDRVQVSLGPGRHRGT